MAKEIDLRTQASGMPTPPVKPQRPDVSKLILPPPVELPQPSTLTPGVQAALDQLAKTSPAEPVSVKVAETERIITEPSEDAFAKAQKQFDEILSGPIPPETTQVVLDSPPPLSVIPTTMPPTILTNCPHCSFPLDQPDIPEPDSFEKQSFLQSILGQKAFIKEYDLFGAKVRVRLRTLTVREIDVIYKQVYWERQHDIITNNLDALERINRFRMYLQLQRLTSDDFDYDLPDGYSKETNQYATECWKLDVPSDPLATGLPQIEDYIATRILSHEPLHRKIYAVCQQFNRLVAKLGDLVDNSDFWKETEEQS